MTPPSPEVTQLVNCCVLLDSFMGLWCAPPGGGGLEVSKAPELPH